MSFDQRVVIALSGDSSCAAGHLPECLVIVKPKWLRVFVLVNGVELVLSQFCVRVMAPRAERVFLFSSESLNDQFGFHGFDSKCKSHFLLFRTPLFAR